MGRSGNNHLFVVLPLQMMAVILLLNVLLPYPDSNDFYELSRICLLMDSDVRYCVNTNWGFAHPLLCWLTTRVTGNLLIAQRSINAFFSLLLLFFAVKTAATAELNQTKRCVVIPAFFMVSPWMLELLISVHLDIVPITFVVISLYLLINGKGAASVFMAGVFAGAAYFFRFHFISFAVLTPLMALLMKRKKMTYPVTFLTAAAGVLPTLMIPHILCWQTYGVFSISNQKFVLAQAAGIADWSYEFALKLEALSIRDIIGTINIPLLLMRYGYRLLKSGLFPFLLLYTVIVYRTVKNDIFHRFDSADVRYRMVLVGSYALLAVLPFTLVRGFTYRLEAAAVLFLLPFICWIVHRSEFRIFRGIMLVVLIVHYIAYLLHFVDTRNNLIRNATLVSANIPVSILKDQPEKVICCIDYYNPYNRYLLCNPMVHAGWGVRFKPLVEKFGFFDLTNVQDTKYDQVNYLVIPSGQEPSVYPEKSITDDDVLYKDEKILIMER